MGFKIPLFIILCVANLLPIGSAPVSTVLEVGGIVMDVVKLALRVIETTDKFESDETPSDLNDLIAEIDKRIDTSTTDIITSVTLQSKLYRVEDVVINIHSSLIDLKSILQATNRQQRDEYRRLFVTRFEQHEVIKHLRFLPQLLEYNIPGTSGKLVDLLAEKCRCNMTAIYDFKKFYIEMISDGISLQLAYLRFSTNVSLNKTLEDWSIRLVNIAQTFQKQETTCVSKFQVYANEDVRNADNALKLWTDNKERYIWKNSDVLFLKPYGTHQFLYYIKSDNSLFWHKSSIRNKFAIFTNKHQPKPDYAVLKDAKGKINSSILGESDEDAAKHVGIAAENHLRERGYATKIMLVFFDGGEFASEKIKIDTDSPVLQISTNEVTLSYCYASGLVCNLDTANWYGEKKSVTGQMKVYVYVENSSDFILQHRETGSSARNEPIPILVYSFLAFCIEVFRTK